MGRSRFEDEGGHEGGMERWLITYADLITLLLAFFVIMYAMSSVDATKYAMMAKSLEVALGMEKTGQGLVSSMSGQQPGETGSKSQKDAASKKNDPAPKVATLVDMKEAKENRELTYMMKRIKEYTDEKKIVGSLSTTTDGRGLVVNLSDSVLFESGKADLSPKAKEILDAIADILLDSEKQIKVEGHTDNVPIRNERYPSNWQLSTDRATNVIMYWIEKHPEASGRLSAAGYGEHRTIAKNDTVAGRAKNRRVDIIVLRDSIAKGEPSAGDKGVVKVEEALPKIKE
ncbi:MAG: OmpA family protein [Candidatus Aquicultor sp.]|nr:OmpA family protein [Candidatus Aquicultor sp.]